MANKVGPLIKEARTNAGLTQEQLAKKVDDVSASDISKAERGEKKLTQAALKQIAKATGVTQSSLLEAAKNSTYGKEEKTGGKTASKPSPSKSSSSKKTSLQVTATEKQLVELYRKADSDTKKAAMKLLKDDQDDDKEKSELLSSILGSAMDLLGGKK